MTKIIGPTPQPSPPQTVSSQIAELRVALDTSEHSPSKNDVTPTCSRNPLGVHGQSACQVSDSRTDRS